MAKEFISRPRTKPRT